MTQLIFLSASQTGALPPDTAAPSSVHPTPYGGHLPSDVRSAALPYEGTPQRSSGLGPVFPDASYKPPVQVDLHSHEKGRSIHAGYPALLGAEPRSGAAGGIRTLVRLLAN